MPRASSLHSLGQGAISDQQLNEADTKAVRTSSQFTETDSRRESVAQTERNRPLTLTRCEAAAMCGISVQTFDTWVRKGILPPALLGTRRWSRIAIERHLAGEAVPSLADDQLSPFELWKRDHAH
jgi:hypothetical protein